MITNFKSPDKTHYLACSPKRCWGKILSQSIYEVNLSDGAGDTNSVQLNAQGAREDNNLMFNYDIESTSEEEEGLI